MVCTLEVSLSCFHTYCLFGVFGGFWGWVGFVYSFGVGSGSVYCVFSLCRVWLFPVASFFGFACCFARRFVLFIVLLMLACCVWCCLFVFSISGLV